MSPVYESGDFILLRKLSPKLSSLKLGSRLVFRHKSLGLLIKKVHSVNFNNKTVTFAGENSRSISAQDMGEIALDQIIGKPIMRFKAPGK